MSNETKGKLDNLKGRVKQAAGAVTGDKKLEAEGAAERVKGAAEEKVGKAKRTLEDAVDDASDQERDEEDDL